ncbi:MAG: MaoC/PaaZ C-terminal domain-containing protein [Candidatus Woykebacteria bacterium]
MALDLSAVGKELPPATYEYTDRDVILYALGVGATARDLAFVYERGGLLALPTFGVVPAFSALTSLGTVLEFNPLSLLHGEQRIELHGQIPTSGVLTTQGRITGIYDKRRGALVVIDADTKDAEGRTLVTNRFGAFILGEGGFGGVRDPNASKQHVLPTRPPDYTMAYKTSQNQAVLYRLSGDLNPLHIDPGFAKLAGFERPILHGLCTFGHVGCAVLHACCGGDPSRLKILEARFSGEVYPGETIITDIWQDGSTAILQARTEERDKVVISNAAATIA